MRNDILNDALSALKNAESAGQTTCRIKPSSALIGRVLGVMRDHGYVQEVAFTEDGRGGYHDVWLAGTINDCGVIKPRFAVKQTDLQEYESRYLPAQDFGVLILTTTQGVLSHSQAKEEGVGGRLLAYVY